jgi:hypothetical protein
MVEGAALLPSLRFVETRCHPTCSRYSLSFDADNVLRLPNDALILSFDLVRFHFSGSMAVIPL